MADAAVIPVPDDAAGELPKAFVVKSSSVGLEDNDRMLIRDIQKHVEKEKARHKWLKVRSYIDDYLGEDDRVLILENREAWNLSMSSRRARVVRS